MPLLNPLALLSACFGHSLVSPCPSFPISLCLVLILWSIILTLFCEPLWRYHNSLVLCHQLFAALGLHSLCHAYLFGAGGCWSIPFIHDLVFSTCLVSPISPVSCFGVVWVFFCWCPNYFGGITLQLPPPFCCQTSF